MTRPMALAVALCLLLAPAAFGQCGCGPRTPARVEAYYVAPGAASFPTTGPLLPTPDIAGPVPLVGRNCNFAVRATEDFANRVIARCRTDQGPVRDHVLGADVFGGQSTTTRTRLNFKPCPRAALFELEVSGDIDTRTVGVTPQAQVQSLGRHQFLMSKELEFDGQLIRTRSPTMYVSPSQVNIAAMTAVSRVPVLGGIANSVALRAANARNPLAARITADRITQQAGPEFNNRVDAEIGRLNGLLSGEIRRQLEQYRLAPSVQSLSTSDVDLLWCVTLDVPTPPPPLPVERSPRTAGRAGALYLHDSLVNDLLERLPLHGLGVPDAAIDRWFSALASGAGLSALGSRGEPIEPQLATIIFDQRQPVRLRFDDGTFELILRLGFAPVAGPAIASQEITIPFTVELDAQAVRFHPGEVSIAPADPDEPGGVLDEAARLLIREQVQNRLRSRSAPRVIPFQLPDAPSTSVTISRITLEQGWLSIAFD